MRKSFSVLVGLVMASTLGVGYITPKLKSYQPGVYYTGNQVTDGVDVRSLYNSYKGGSVVATDCKKDSKPLPANMSLFDTGYASSDLLWFWAMKEPVKGLLKPKSDSNKEGYRYSDDTYWWTVAKGTYLVSVGNSNLVAASQHVNKAYPDAGETNGVSMQIIVKDTKRSKAFLITYKSMLKWWCCIDKVNADYFQGDDKNQPRYGHTVKFSDEDRFTSGSVIGVAGITSENKYARDSLTNNALVGIEVKACTIKDGLIDYNWAKSSLEDLYGTK